MSVVTAKAKLALATVLVLWSFTTLAVAQNCSEADAEALAWLNKMSDSIHRYSYHGVVTLQRSGDMEVVQVAHIVDDGISTESMTQLTGQGARVDRKAHPLECIHPGQQLLQLGAQLQAGNCGIARQYRFSVEGKERIAGRPAVRVGIAPRDMYRHGYHLALDRQTGLLLKAETVGRGDKVLEKFQFASLAYGEIAPDSAQADVIHEAAHPHPDHTSIMSPVDRAWSVKWLPRGFMATDTPAAISGRRSYTDGLAVFSVFLEDFEQQIKPGEGLVREGSTTTYTRGMDLSGQPVLVTVIGEIPVNTARMVANSVKWEP